MLQMDIFIFIAVLVDPPCYIFYPVIAITRHHEETKAKRCEELLCCLACFRIQYGVLCSETVRLGLPLFRAFKKSLVPYK